MAAPPFLDRTAPPSKHEILAGLGSARDRWLRLESWARMTYGIEGELLYAGRDTGWSVRFRRAGRALFTLMPRTDGFGALVVVGPSAWAGAANVALSKQTREAWERAHPYPDGRWLWLTIDDDLAAADVEHLVTLKSPPPQRLRRLASPA
jgi:hypothetical protein